MRESRSPGVHRKTGNIVIQEEGERARERRGDQNV